MGLASAKYQELGITRTRVFQMKDDEVPGYHVQVEKLIAAIAAYINNLAGQTVMYPLINHYGDPQIANVDGNGKLSLIPSRYKAKSKTCLMKVPCRSLWQLEVACNAHLASTLICLLIIRCMSRSDTARCLDLSLMPDKLCLR